MPVVYICKTCGKHENAQVLYTEEGEPRLMPPYHWRAVIFEQDGFPDVICPTCGEAYEAAEPQKKPKKPPRPFGVINGGKS